MKQLIELNNQIELNNWSKEIYQSDSDDDDEDIQFTKEVRDTFCKQYDKKNNRQFKLIRMNY